MRTGRTSVGQDVHARSISASGLATVKRGIGLGVVMVPVTTGVCQGPDGPDVAHASVVTRVAAFDRAFWWTVGLSGLAAVLVPVLPPRAPTGADRRRPAPTGADRRQPA